MKQTEERAARKKAGQRKYQRENPTNDEQMFEMTHTHTQLTPAAITLEKPFGGEHGTAKIIALNLRSCCI